VNDKERLSDLSEFLKLVLFSGWVKPEGGNKPVSAMLVARFESGKTSVLGQFMGAKGVLYMSDVTEYGLVKQYLDPLSKGQIKHIIIPDFIKSINRKKTTVDTLITFFNSLIEEGIVNISTFALRLELKKPIKAALLTSIAVEDFTRMQRRLAAIGFLSRFMILSYDYDKNYIKTIMHEIAQSHGEWAQDKLRLPGSEVRVHLPGGLAEQMIPRAEAIGERLHSYGFRAMHMLMSLVKASALSDRRDEVNMDDIVRVLRLSEDYLGLRYNRIGISGKVERQLPLMSNGKAK